MIGKNIQKFCCEDISLIENYDQAVNDKTQTWDCHHRLETDLGLTRDELIEQGKYFNVPASELIFLTQAEHKKLHGKERCGEKNPMYGRRGKDSPNYGSKRSEETRQKHSENNKGEKNPMFNKHHSKETRKKQSENSALKGTHPTWMNNGITRVFPKTQEEIEHYRSLGYQFGMKLKQLI